jgi:hypothetical protein
MNRTGAEKTVLDKTGMVRSVRRTGLPRSGLTWTRKDRTENYQARQDWNEEERRKDEEEQDISPGQTEQDNDAGPILLSANRWRERLCLLWQFIYKIWKYTKNKLAKNDSSTGTKEDQTAGIILKLFFFYVKRYLGKGGNLQKDRKPAGIMLCGGGISNLHNRRTQGDFSRDLQGGSDVIGAFL